MPNRPKLASIAAFGLTLSLAAALISCTSMSSSDTNTGTNSPSAGPGGNGSGGSGSGGGSSASAQYLYVSSNSISGFHINSDGTLTAISDLPALPPGQLSTAGNMLLVDSSQSSPSELSLFKIAAANGNLTPVSTLAAGAGSATLDPAASTVYTNGGPTNTDTVSGFAINGGSLSPVPASPYQYSIGGGSNPLTALLLQVDPSGKLLYMTLTPQDEHTPAPWFGTALRNSDGSLTGFTATSAGCIGTGSQAVIAANGSSLVYDSCIDDWSGTFWISRIIVNQATGAVISSSGGGFTSTSPNELLLGLAADASGKWLAATDVNNNVVHIMAVDAASGALTDAADRTFPTGTGPSAAAFDHSGKFLYVLNGGFTGNGLVGSGDLSAYAFDASTGMLTPLAGSPYATGPSPTSFVIAQVQ